MGPVNEEIGDVPITMGRSLVVFPLDLDWQYL